MALSGGWATIHGPGSRVWLGLVLGLHLHQVLGHWKQQKGVLRLAFKPRTSQNHSDEELLMSGLARAWHGSYVGRPNPTSQLFPSHGSTRAHRLAMSGVRTGAVHERGRVASVMEGTTPAPNDEALVPFPLEVYLDGLWRFDGRAAKEPQNDA